VLSSEWATLRWSGRGQTVPWMLAAAAMCYLLLGSIAVGAVETWLAELMLARQAQLITDQIDLALVSRLRASEVQPPFSASNLDQLHRHMDPLLVQARQAVSGIVRFDVVAPDGTIIFSDHDPHRTRITLGANPMLQRALAGFGASTTEEPWSPGDAESDSQPDHTVILYRPLILDGQVVGAYEVYQDTTLASTARIALRISMAASLTIVLVLLAHAYWRRPVPVPRAEIGVDSARASVQAEPAGASTAAAPDTRPIPRSDSLTARELEVLRLMATHSTYREIATQLVVGEETVRSHAKNILHKLGVPDRKKAVLAAIDAGLL
jgi:DNA-binding CsgD family transcriptional regulator